MCANDFPAGEERTSVAAGVAQFGVWNRRRACQESIKKSGFARAVPAHQGDFLSTGYAGRETSDDFGVVIGFRNAFELKNVFSRRTLLFELQERTLDVRLGKFRDLQPLDF